MRIISDTDLNQLGNFSVDVLFEENNNIEYIKENGMLKRKLACRRKKLWKN